MEKAEDLILDEVKKKCIKKILENAKELNRHLFIPTRFSVALKPPLKEGTPDWAEAVNENRTIWPLNPDNLSEMGLKVEETDEKKEDDKHAKGKKDSKKDTKKDTKKGKDGKDQQKEEEAQNVVEFDPNFTIVGYDPEYI